MKWKAVEWKTLSNATQPWTAGGVHWVLPYCPEVFRRFSVCCYYRFFVFSSHWSRMHVSPTFSSMPRRESPKRVHFALLCKSAYLPTRWRRERDRQFVAGESAAEFCESLQDWYPALKDACHWNFPANSLLALCLHHRVLQATSSKSRFNQLVHLTAWLRVVSEEHLWL